METEVQATPLPAQLAQPLILDVAKVKGEIVPAAAQALDAALADNDPLKKQADEAAKRLVAIPTARYDDARTATLLDDLRNRARHLTGDVGRPIREPEIAEHQYARAAAKLDRELVGDRAPAPGQLDQLRVSAAGIGFVWRAGHRVRP